MENAAAGQSQKCVCKAGVTAFEVSVGEAKVAPFLYLLTATPTLTQVYTNTIRQPSYTHCLPS